MSTPVEVAALVGDDEVPRVPTRQAIATAAEALFAEGGYAGTSVRAVAARAGVDPSLVIRHFGTKDALFLQTVPLAGYFEPITEGPLDGMGERLVAWLLSPGRRARLSTYRVMMRASDRAVVREKLVEALEQLFITPLAPRLTGPEPQLRARLIAAQIGGLLDAMTMIEDPLLAEADQGSITRVYGAAIQLLIDPPG